MNDTDALTYILPKGNHSTQYNRVYSERDIINNTFFDKIIQYIEELGVNINFLKKNICYILFPAQSYLSSRLKIPQCNKYKHPIWESISIERPPSNFILKNFIAFV